MKWQVASGYCPMNPDCICAEHQSHDRCRERLLAQIQELRDNPDLMLRKVSWP